MGNDTVVINGSAQQSRGLSASNSSTPVRPRQAARRDFGELKVRRERLIDATVDAVADGGVARLVQSR